ncbi:hypothetical protein GWI33_000683 [Rhynchophorus ferrugineus]|uniref:Uncharacterized protein n=1 Tax=Rhynchophorus ferrugineus TaxID=354439 RepID=A0A834MM04_RHYFE|nr:hypothetical protein GWI33_000683 [Rhynchophorus ferrugineus]
MIESKRRIIRKGLKNNRTKQTEMEKRERKQTTIRSDRDDHGRTPPSPRRYNVLLGDIGVEEKRGDRMTRGRSKCPFGSATHDDSFAHTHTYTLA